VKKSSRATFAEALIAVIVAGLIGAGLWLDRAQPDLSAPPRAGTSGRLFEGNTLFCPPPSPGAASTVAVASPIGVQSVGVAVAGDGGAGDLGDLAAGRTLIAHSGGGGPTEVAASGGTVVAGAASSATGGDERGSSAARCSEEAASAWYFAEGSSSLGVEERLVLYNPFPDESVARVAFYTPAGEELKANLADVAVPSGEAVSLRVNDYILRRRSLAAEIDALRGRVVAWKTVAASVAGDGGEGAIRGVYSTLGATEPSATWYFPEGGAGGDISERISVLNPSRREAIVTVSLNGSSRSVQPPSLVEIPIPPKSSSSVALGSVLKSSDAAGGLSAVVQSTNGVPVVAERTVTYSSAGLTGIATELGADGAATAWSLGAGLEDASDDTVIVMNPGSRDANVDVVLLGRRGPVEPAALKGIPVPSGSRRIVSVERWTRSRPSIALLNSDNPVVVERRSYAGVDVALEMGRPLEDAH